MSRTVTNKDDFQTRLSRMLEWQTATRDDALVAGELNATRAMDRVYALNIASFFDELFHYIREIGAWPLLEGMDPQDRKGALYPFIQFVLVTIMRCVGGLQSALAMQEVLLTDEALMSLVGFNAVQVQQGSNERGLSRRTSPCAIRGAMSYETIADNIVKVGPDKLAALFNGVIRCLAKQGMFPKKIDVSLDATDDEATPTYKTAAGKVPSVTREKRPDVRANKHASKVRVTVFGWKIWLVFEPVSQIPLAMVIDDINVADNEHAFKVLAQAQANVAGYARLRSVALDRGFLDGKLLTLMENGGRVIVYIPAKSNMAITADARAIARKVEALAKEGKSLGGATCQVRVEKVRRGSGKNARIEVLQTIVVRIRNLPCDWWKEDGATSAANSKDFSPKLVNATVVLCRDGVPKEAGKEVVILDTDPSDNAFAGFDAYDDRSLIENICNREAKESWFLEHHPKRSEAGVRVHAYLVFTCMALVTAFRIHRKAAEKAERRGKETGIGRYRRQLEAENNDKVIIFCGDRFGIFRNYEVFLLVGISVRERELMGESAGTILARCQAKTLDSS